MKELKPLTRLYLLFIYLFGAGLLVWNLVIWQPRELLVLAALCILGTAAMFVKSEGATNRSHYTFSFIVYAFAVIYLGVAPAAIVVIVSVLVEYIFKHKKIPWYIQVFNTTTYIIVLQATEMAFNFIRSGQSLATPAGILAIIAGMAVFTLLNHLIVGIVLWLARGENFRESGIFDILPLIIDLSLLTLGGMMVLLWNYNPYSLLLFIFPIYMIYGTMRVPSLERKTEIDQKTGLFNHTYFMEHLENELTRANRYDRPMTIIMADLDLLRNINNTYGHLAGDEVLLGIANILRQSVREYDVVARFGGEEFSVMMPETSLELGHERAEAIRRAIERADFVISTSIEPIKVTISLGISTREEINQTSQEIIHNADTALYHAKLKGRNRAYAFSQDAYIRLPGAPPETEDPQEEEIPADTAPDPLQKAATAYQAANARIEKRPESEVVQPPAPESEGSTPQSEPRGTKASVYGFIAGVFIAALAAFGGLYVFAPELYKALTIPSWLGLAGFAFLVVLTEWYSIDLYTKSTSLSTSAVPILAGTLLFGPIGSLVLSLTYAIISGIKYRSPFNKFVFNFSNQLLVGILYTAIVALTGRSFIELSTLDQLAFAVLAAVIVYGVNTGLISIGMHLDSRQPILPFWKEHYSWLFSIYIGMGVVAAAFVFGYKHDPLIGSLLFIVPLLLLRFSQVQYVDRTRDMVQELREKNIDLEKYTDDITKLNEGLLDTLAEVIDLRDPFVLGHSRGVTNLATRLAERLDLHEKQVELVRKGSLLHDIGKLGISQTILAKPARLTPEEYEVIKNHPQVGAALLEKSPHLRPMIPIVLQHHEYYNGGGYPGKLSGNQIAIEARIVTVADAVEAMTADRPYRKSRDRVYIIDELKRCSGTQFDPRIVEVAVQILLEMGADEIVGEPKQSIPPQHLVPAAEPSAA